MTTKPADEVKVPSRIWVQMIDGSTMGSGVAFTNRVEEGDVEFVPASELARVRRDFQDRLVAKLRAMKENIVPINTMLEIIDDTRRDESEGQDA